VWVRGVRERLVVVVVVVVVVGEVMWCGEE